MNGDKPNVYMVHYSKLPTLDVRLRNINNKVSKNGENGQLTYDIIGKTEAPYTNSAGVTSLSDYYQVRFDGAVKFKNMDCLGKISFIDKDSDNIIFRKFKADELLDAGDRKFLEQPHSRNCACCNQSRERNDLYIFKCKQDMDGPRDIKFKAGEYYQIGTSCVDEFMGKGYFEAVNDLTGTVDERKTHREASHKPTHYDAKLLEKYVLIVGKYHLDDALAYHSLNGDAEIKDKYDYPETHRTCKARDGKNHAYGYEGSIIKTAKALYCINELDPTVYNYSGVLASNNPELAAKREEILKEICNNYKFNSDGKACTFKDILNSDDLNKTVDVFFDSKNFKTAFSSMNKDADGYLVGFNKDYVMDNSTCLIRDDCCQVLVDLSDVQYLSQPTKKCFMHEAENRLFEVSEYGYNKFRYIDPNYVNMNPNSSYFGRERAYFPSSLEANRNNMTYDNVMNYMFSKHNTLNTADSYLNTTIDRLNSCRFGFNIIPDEKIKSVDIQSQAGKSQVKSKERVVSNVKVPVQTAKPSVQVSQKSVVKSNHQSNVIAQKSVSSIDVKPLPLASHGRQPKNQSQQVQSQSIRKDEIQPTERVSLTLSDKCLPKNFKIGDTNYINSYGRNTVPVFVSLGDSCARARIFLAPSSIEKTKVPGVHRITLDRDSTYTIYSDSGTKQFNNPDGSKRRMTAAEIVTEHSKAANAYYKSIGNKVSDKDTDATKNYDK